jgi:hypothetical protein
MDIPEPGAKQTLTSIIYVLMSSELYLKQVNNPC